MKEDDKATPVKQHKICKGWRIFKAVDSRHLEQTLDKFANDHEVVGVQFHFVQVDQSGMMLCDRVNPDQPTYMLDIATVTYMRDVTQEMVDADLLKWLAEKVDERYKVGPAPQFIDPMSFGHPRLMLAEHMKEYAKELMDSDEYKALQKELEDKYSI